ncbi:SIN1-domain-containing protein [Cutaneotrichosporon oleaginosum]|uniref:SIN1-domain-containing protein n=1 Tax=Cutaneotrichosporon oleaginosum TaxID=879819 RepID=A0A0J0XPH5_9TREE|nr:SIN1-domain-containing protein [Cutaneotrichosporon oleaginosum]KLT42972.1 SIN1-domain-containing protein [Cutaneotrichosporon oleaginosum]TXT11819.1 hypothetical protein COLE_02229 [Cutaneotrichosporon oleaginosum]
MAMISDSSYVLHAIRLSALRTTDDSVTPRIVTMDHAFASNPYVNAMGLGDIDRWPELKRALDSPPPDPSPLAIDSDDGLPDLSRRPAPSGGGAMGLRYTQTIMPAGRIGGAGMRVSGRDGAAFRGRRRHSAQRSQSSSMEVRPPIPPPPEEGRPRASSTASEPSHVRSPDEDIKPSLAGTIGYDPDGSSIGVAESALPSDMAMTVTEGDPDVDEGDDDDEAGAEAPPVLGRPGHARHPSQIRLEAAQGGRPSTIHEEDRRSSTDTFFETKLEFGRIAIPPTIPGSVPNTSALTATLNQHVPHLVSTGGAPPDGEAPTASNPFASLYASVAAPPTIPSLKLELFFPHSDDPSNPILATVRKDATVEEVTGHGLWKYVEEGRSPDLELDDAEQSTVGWGLRIVEDDGEVDEDFPPLDRESAISKFSYGQFGVVRATDSQKKQNAAMAPMIQRRPSRIIADTRPRRPQPMPTVMSPEEDTPLKQGLSAGSRPVLLHVYVRASADVQFNTTISAPSDMYIADLTEVLVSRKNLPQPASDWVLCLADLSLALPPDRTVASLEGMNELTLVRGQWAAEHGLRGDMRGGDPSASIFKRASEPPAKWEMGQTYKKYTVMRKTPIGRHERQLAIDGDYIHIMPSENRAFFDSLKTTSIHITLVAGVKLSGRAGGFKLYVWRDGSRKRYEFEAENVKQAQEIVESIEAL